MKIKPHNIEIERLVLGAILLESSAIGEVYDLLKPNCFYHERHAEIYSVMRQLYDFTEPIDIITVATKLKPTSKFDQVDDLKYISALTSEIASAANIYHHAQILKELYLKRRLIEIGQEVALEAYKNDSDAFEAHDKMLSMLNDLQNDFQRNRQATFSEIYTDRLEAIKKAGSDKTYKTGTPAFLSWLDRQTNGFQKTDLIIIAARPAMGKTALVTDFLRKQAMNGIPVGMFSLEMSATQLVDRVIAQTNEIDLATVRKGGMTYDQWQRVDENTKTLYGLPIMINDTGGQSINDICAIAKTWKLKYDIQALYVDYLQLITVAGLKGNREQEISTISRRLKALAKDLQIPVIALSQLSRRVEERHDKRPLLSDLRESGAIEQDADMVIFIYRAGYYDGDDTTGLTELIIAKFRNGDTGAGKVKFLGQYQKFVDVDSYSPIEAPEGFSRIQQEEPFDKF